MTPLMTDVRKAASNAKVESAAGVRLLPCPFCGGTGKPTGFMSWTHVNCESCRADGPSVFHGGPTDDRATRNRCEADAVAAWNRRAPQAQGDGVVALRADGSRVSLAECPIGLFLAESGELCLNWRQSFSVRRCCDWNNSSLPRVRTAALIQWSACASFARSHPLSLFPVQHRKRGRTRAMAKVHLVWNGAMSECVGFLDKRDADYTATGNMRKLEYPGVTPTVGDAFRESYGEDRAHLPQTTVDLDAPPVAAPPVEGWRPIETAPKDFVTEIDIWGNGERWTDCSWMRPTYGPKEYRWCRHAYDDCNGPVFNEVVNPTHWMPLPTQPDSQGGEDAAD